MEALEFVFMWLKSHLLCIKYFIHRVAKRSYHIIDIQTGETPARLACQPPSASGLFRSPLMTSY